MIANLTLAAAAEADLASAVDSYDKLADGLGDAFIAIVEEVFDGIR